jgi:hypothetical protein
MDWRGAARGIRVLSLKLQRHFVFVLDSKDRLLAPQRVNRKLKTLLHSPPSVQCSLRARFNKEHGSMEIQPPLPHRPFSNPLRPDTRVRARPAFRRGNCPRLRRKLRSGVGRAPPYLPSPQNRRNTRKYHRSACPHATWMPSHAKKPEIPLNLA